MVEDTLAKKAPQFPTPTANTIKNKFMVFIKCLIDNPAFDSQSKETLSTRPQGKTYPTNTLLMRYLHPLTLSTRPQGTSYLHTHIPTYPLTHIPTYPYAHTPLITHEHSTYTPLTPLYHLSTALVPPLYYPC